MDNAAALMEVRPRLGHDVLFADTGDGVLLRRNDTGFIVRGRSAYRLASMLLPHLSGDHALGDLCRDLSPAHSTMIRDLVGTLLDRGFARDSRPGPKADLAPEVLRRFEGQINYIEHYNDDAAVRFQRFRTARVLLAGGGPISRAAGLGLLRNGLRRLDIATDGSVPAKLAETARQLVADGCEASVQLFGRTEALLDPAVLEPYDLVIAPAEELGPKQVLQLARLRVPSGPILLPAVVIGGSAVIGPAGHPAGTPCWSCAMLRLSESQDQRDIAALWRDVALGLGRPADVPGEVLAAMIGNMLGYDAFRLLAGDLGAGPERLGAETEGAVVIQDLRTLEVTRERVLPHPRCPNCREEQPTPPRVLVREPAEAGRVPNGPDAEALRERLKRHTELVGRNCGILLDFADTSIDQSPLKVGRVRLSHDRVITAFDVHLVPIARARAVQAGVLAYVHANADVHEAVRNGPDSLDLLAHLIVPHSGLAVRSGIPADPASESWWMPATSLVSGHERLVPAAAVYPLSEHNRLRVIEPTAAGDGAGTDAAGAVLDGLLSALAYDALLSSAAGGAAHRIVIGEQTAGTEVDFLLRTAGNYDLEVELLDLAPEGPAHVVLARTVSGPGTCWAVGAELSREDAVVTAMRDLLGQVQLDDPSLDTGSPLVADLDVSVIRVDGDAAERPAVAAKDLPGLIASRGRDAFVVQTTTPDLGLSGGLITVRVLLTPEAGARS
ncbi:TOMM precursor leader peptide-binding protein [Microbispora sp. CA-135349]|uniref:TOMM precursor leader peptide-binding protein n=1 Tax=Microbispora sp. CA-135349 TaxID=3239953 RepID=UPI003D8ACF7A